MAKKRKKSKSRQKTGLFSSRSELRKGYTIPTIKRIKTALRKKSKEFIINLFMKAFARLTKTEKMRMLMLIERGKIISTIRRKTKRKGKAKGKRKAKGKGFQGKPKGSKAEKTAIAKARRARKRKR